MPAPASPLRLLEQVQDDDDGQRRKRHSASGEYDQRDFCEQQSVAATRAGNAYSLLAEFIQKMRITVTQKTAVEKPFHKLDVI